MAKSLFLFLLVFQTEMKGQQQIKTGPVTTMDRVSFRLREQKSPNDAMNAIVRLRVDDPINGMPVAVSPPRICDRVGNSSNYDCQNYIPTYIVQQLNVRGTHRLYSYTWSNTAGDSQASDPWTIVTP